METPGKETSRSYDVVIIGAGISGINTAYRLQTELPGVSYTILENRSAMGGTWDLFRYPGIRSDSTLWTFGFRWRPWTEEKAIADGSSILNYMKQSAQETSIDQKIKFNHKLVSANWSSDAQNWVLQVEANGKLQSFHAGFLALCTGYYDYDTPLAATISGLENFNGPVIHPQFWPEPSSIDLSTKKAVIIGSGATAITLVPALAKTCAHVTMLQRSPTYIVPARNNDPLRQTLKRYLPMWLVYRIMRVRSLFLTLYFNKYCALFPARARAFLKQVTMKLLPANIPHDPHFEPKYNPWEQRLCLCPDGDFYKSLRSGNVSVVTDTIAQVTESQIELTSGRKLNADVIVTATGLKLRFGGGAQFSVDNEPVEFKDKFLWKAAMIQDVPNIAFTMGYPNASWTLGADCAAWLVCRVLKYMRQKGLTSATPRVGDNKNMEATSILQLTSTYVTKGNHDMPKAGNKAPWFPRSSYLWDLWDAKYGSIVKSMDYRKVSS